ncbi:MAG: protein TolR [Arenicellales bacterium]|nr:protein TolR [Arenicellales bacterium]
MHSVVRRRNKKQMAEINVVPYIDVMLVLLVIFMVTAPLLTEGVKVDLVKADAKQIDSKELEPVVVSVDEEGKYFIDKEAKEPDAIRAYAAAVLRRNPKVEFMVRGDKDVAYEAVVHAMVLLQQAGVPSVGLITDPEGS